MTIRGIQRGQQVIPGIQPTDASTDAQASDGAVTDFSALLSQMASQVGTATSDSAGVALIKTLNATAANRQDTKAPEPTRPRPERDRPERAEPASRSGEKADRSDARAAEDDKAAAASDAVDTTQKTDPSAADVAVAQAVAQVAVAAPVVTDADAAAAAADAAAAQPEQIEVAAAAQAQSQTVAQDARPAGQAQQGATQQGRVQRDDVQTQTAQAVQGAADGQQAQSDLTDQGAGQRDQTGNRPHLAEHQAKAAKTASAEVQAATNADATADTAKASEGPLTTVNAAQSKGLAKAIGDDRQASVQVQVAAPSQQAVSQQAAPADDAPAPSAWYDLAKASAPAPSGGASAAGQVADATQPQPLTGLGAVAAAMAPGGAANSAATSSAAASGGVDGVEGVKATSGTSQTSSSSAPASAGSATAQQQAQHAGKAQQAKAAARAQQAEEPDPVEQIRVRIQQDATKGETIKIALRPDNLGKVEVKLDIREGKVNAQVVAETSEALEMMKTDARGLEKALNDAGLKADPGSVTFSLKDNGTQQQMAQQDQGQGSRQGGTPYDRVGHSLEDDLAPAVGTIDALRSMQAAARGGVDVKI